MTTFTLEGGFNHKTVQVTWEDGELSGDEQLVAIIERWVAGSQGALVVASGGPSASTDHLENPWVANELMQMFLDTPKIVDGSLPAIPEGPEGETF
jgi:hypothetical protein